MVFSFAIYNLPARSGLSHAPGMACFEAKRMELNGAKVTWGELRMGRDAFYSFSLSVALLYSFYCLPTSPRLSFPPAWPSFRRKGWNSDGGKLQGGNWHGVFFVAIRFPLFAVFPLAIYSLPTSSGHSHARGMACFLGEKDEIVRRKEYVE